MHSRPPYPRRPLANASLGGCLPNSIELPQGRVDGGLTRGGPWWRRAGQRDHIVAVGYHLPHSFELPHRQTHNDYLILFEDVFWAAAGTGGKRRRP
jgi:hypothetical protein